MTLQTFPWSEYLPRLPQVLTALYHVCILIPRSVVFPCLKIFLNMVCSTHLLVRKSLGFFMSGNIFSMFLFKELYLIHNY